MKNVFIGILIAISLGSVVYGINLKNDLKIQQNEIKTQTNINNSNQPEISEDSVSEEVSQNIVIDNEFIKIIVNSNMQSQKGVYTNLYIENKTKENINVSINKISVNNKNVSTKFEDTLSPNEKKVSDIRWDLKDIKNIKDLKLINGTLSIKGYKKIFSGEIQF